MTIQLLGKSLVQEMAGDITARVQVCKERGILPTLALLRVGSRPDDMSYERTAMKRAESLGIATKQIVLDDNATQEELEAAIDAINNDEAVHGCLMFRPLPAHLREQDLCNRLAPEKDIDGISYASLASVFTGDSVGYPPCTASACCALLDHYGIKVEGKKVVVIGRSLVIGKPVSLMMLNRHASVTMCHSRSEGLQDLVRAADIVICAVGRARMFSKYFFVPGQVVLDVGINFDAEGNLCGDVDYDAVAPIVDYITPVPGGIGSVTTQITMDHVVRAAEARI